MIISKVTKKIKLNHAIILSKTTSTIKTKSKVKAFLTEKNNNLKLQKENDNENYY